MRILLTTLLVSGSTLVAAPPEPVALKNGTAPTKRYEVVLEADKDTPSFKRYELKGDDSDFPAILVRELPSHRIVGRLSWSDDPSGGDSQPLRSHTEVLWSPTGEAAAINTSWLTIGRSTTNERARCYFDAQDGGKEVEAMRQFKCARLLSAQKFLLEGEEEEAYYEFFHSLEDATPEALFSALDGS